MKASEALIAWDTNTSKKTPRVYITKLGMPESVESRYAECSGGAAYMARRDMNGMTQLACVLHDFVSVVACGVPPEQAHEAFLQIDEYADAICASHILQSPGTGGTKDDLPKRYCRA